jgi:hypothetical protein
MESLIGAGVSVFVYTEVLKPRIARHRVRALVDIDRIAHLASVSKDDISFTVIGSYRVMHEGRWSPHYGVNFCYKDLSMLVGRQRNPFVCIGETVEFDEWTDRRKLEEVLAARLRAVAART